MGYQDAIASIGIPTTADNAPSNGTVDGVDSFDTKKTYAEVDYATNETGALDETAKNAAHEASWSITNSYGNNDYAYEVARNALSQPTYGTNPFSNEDFTRALYMEKGAGSIFYGLA